MTIDILALAAAFIVGLVFGTIFAGAMLLEREFWWTTCLRLPEALHRALRKAAEAQTRSLKAEITHRLERSFEGGGHDRA
jgi:Arc-like DNA binding domain